MAQFPALPLFTDAFIADTTHLSAQQTGAYLLLLMAAWRSPDCKLPDDDKILARFARMNPRQWAQNKSLVMSFWRQDAMQKWYQARLLDEHAFAVAIRTRNVAAGKASALKRHETRSTTVATEAQQDGNPLTLTLNQVKKDTTYPKKEPATPAARGQRLKVYLDEVGEDAAGCELGLWAMQELGLDLATINTEMAKFCDYWNATPGQKGVKLDWPATWRNWCRSAKEKLTKEATQREIWSRKRT